MTPTNKIVCIKRKCIFNVKPITLMKKTNMKAQTNKNKPVSGELRQNLYMSVLWFTMSDWYMKTK